MSVLDIIKKNFNDSQLGDAVNSLPSDKRTTEEKMKDMIASNPNTPASLTQPMSSPVAPVASPVSPAPLPGLGAPVGPAPASVSTPAQPQAMPQGNWAIKANPSQAAAASNPYAAGMQAARQVAAVMPQAGVGMQMGANQNIAQAQEKGFGEQAQALGEQGKALEESNARLQEVQKQRETAQKEFDTKYDEALKDLKGTQIDSGRLWKNASTGQKVLTGIGLALSAFGGPEAVARTNNIINQAIDRDIEDQKMNYAKKKEGVQEMSGVYNRMLQRFGDKEKAELATRATYIDLTKTKIDQIAARTNSATAKENAKLLNGQLQEKKDAIVGQLGLALGQTAQNAPKKYNEVLPDNYSPKNEDEMKRYIPGVGLATDPEAAKGVREDVNNFNRFNDSLSRLIELRKQYGSETLPTKAKGEMEMLHGKLVLAMKDMAKLGVMSDTDFKLLNNIVANPTSYGPNVLSNLEALKGRSIGEFQKSLGTRLMNPIQSLPAKLQRGTF